MSGFIVYGLPRSRTAWLARFLSYGEWHCGHEELRHARSLADVKAWWSQPCTGTAETAAAPFWRLVPSDVRVVVIRRPVDEVVESLARLGFDRDAMLPLMRRQDAKLDQIEKRVPGVLSVRFADLENEATCARVFEHCLPYKHDPAWWATIAPVNIQIDMRTLVRYAVTYREPMAKLARQAKQHILTQLARKPAHEPDGITFRQERFADWYRDAQPLFKEHMLATGQDIEDFRKKNIPLLQAIDDIGFMQITTARCNGRMFGYVMAVLSPSLDATDELDAMHLPFFASKEFPGLGLKLQRASIEALRARGADRVFLRAGVRGDGPRLGSLYKRLGAKDFGQLFELNLVEA